MSDIIKFEFDQPVELALKFAEPKVFASQFAGGDDRHMFSTTDGRVMYTTPLVAAKIKALGVQPGEFFFICKRKDGRLTDYAVYREGNEPPAASRPTVVSSGGWSKKTFPPLKSNLPERLYAKPEPTPTAPDPSSVLERQLAASIALVERRKLEQVEPVPAAMPKPPAAAAEPAWVGTLISHTNHLVDAFAASLAHASKNHGNAVKADDIRSLLVTSFIQLAQKGGRNAA
jgi:hypothetical protein